MHAAILFYHKLLIADKYRLNLKQPLGLRVTLVKARENQQDCGTRADDYDLCQVRKFDVLCQYTYLF